MTQDILENVGRRKTMFLIIIGVKTYGLVLDPLTPNRSINKSYPEIDKVFKKHFQSKLLEIVQHYKFYTCIRKTDKPVADFKHISDNCNFSVTLEIMMWDRIVCGINDETIL